MRATYILTPGDRRTRCLACELLRPVRSIENGICGECRADGATRESVDAFLAKRAARIARGLLR